MDLKEENLRLKLALASMVVQFYDYRIDIEDAIKYDIKHDEDDETVECYFHMFESAGERAWNMLGFDKPIISESEMWKLQDSLRDELLEMKYKSNNANNVKLKDNMRDREVQKRLDEIRNRTPFTNRNFGVQKINEDNNNNF